MEILTSDDILKVGVEVDSDLKRLAYEKPPVSLDVENGAFIDLYSLTLERGERTPGLKRLVRDYCNRDLGKSSRHCVHLFLIRQNVPSFRLGGWTDWRNDKVCSGRFPLCDANFGESLSKGGFWLYYGAGDTVQKPMFQPEPTVSGFPIDWFWFLPFQTSEKHRSKAEESEKTTKISDLPWFDRRDTILPIELRSRLWARNCGGQKPSRLPQLPT